MAVSDQTVEQIWALYQRCLELDRTGKDFRAQENEIRGLITSIRPKFLYKYQPLDDCRRESLEKGHFLYINSVDELNDPEEVRLHASFLAVLEHWALAKGVSKEEFRAETEYSLRESGGGSVEEFERDVLTLGEMQAVERHLAPLLEYWRRHQSRFAAYSKSLRAWTKLCSLCESHDSPLMWSHYAAGHKGFCLSFDSRDLWSIASERRGLLLPVRYSEARHDAAELVAFEALSKQREGSSKISRRMATYHFARCATTKSLDWFYEREWRLLFIGKRAMGGLLPPRKPLPKEVILGSRMEGSDKEFMLKIASAHGLAISQAYHGDDGRFVMTKRELSKP